MMGDKPAIILLALEEDRLQEQLQQLAQMAKAERGRFVVAFARDEILERARKAGATFDAVVNIHAAEHDGLFQTPDGGHVVPTVFTARIIAMWVWMGEFVAACTRLGKMPPMYQSIAVPPGYIRITQDISDPNGFRRFHGAVPPRIPPGKLGREYIRELGRNLSTMHDSEMADIRAAAALAVRARRNGNALYTAPFGHSVPHHPQGYFESFDETREKLKEQGQDAKFNEGDFVLVLGYDWPIPSGIEASRAGAIVAWSITSYKLHEIECIAPDEILIDQHWALGDALVAVPGYDVKICPPSGVLAEAVLWMVNAEMHSLLHDSAAAPGREHR